MPPFTNFLAALAIAAAASATLAAQTAPPAFSVERTGTGRPMILIPGLLSHGEVWNATVAQFSATHDMHVLTLAGFAGTAPTAADPFLASTRDAIIQYIRDQKLERPILVGHSLGAFLSLWIAARAPELVGPVIAVDGVPFLSTLGDTTMTAERVAPQAAAIRTAFAAMDAQTLGAQTRMAMASQARDSAWHSAGARWGAASDGATAGRAVAEMLTTDIRQEVAAIRTPVLLLMAGNGLPPEQQQMVLARYRAQVAMIPDARVIAAANTLHFIMLDDAQFFHSTVAAFLADR